MKNSWCVSGFILTSYDLVFYLSVSAKKFMDLGSIGVVLDNNYYKIIKHMYVTLLNWTFNTLTTIQLQHVYIILRDCTCTLLLFISCQVHIEISTLNQLLFSPFPSSAAKRGYPPVHAVVSSTAGELRWILSTYLCVLDSWLPKSHWQCWMEWME